MLDCLLPVVVVDNWPDTDRVVGPEREPTWAGEPVKPGAE